MAKDYILDVHFDDLVGMLERSNRVPFGAKVDEIMAQNENPKVLRLRLSWPDYQGELDNG
jgi:hypothetical protein